MAVQEYNLMNGDWLGLGVIINDLATRVVGQIVAPGSSPSFAGGTITGNLVVGGTLTADTLTDGTAMITGGLGTFGAVTIFNPIPILVFKDSTYTGDVSLGYIEWRDSANTRLGFFGNASSSNDDLFWRNESSGGHIKIETTGAGEFQISAETVLSVLTASRLVQTDANKALASVTDLTSWIAGTGKQILVTDDADGTITLGLGKMYLEVV